MLVNADRHLADEWDVDGGSGLALLSDIGERRLCQMRLLQSKSRWLGAQGQSPVGFLST